MTEQSEQSAPFASSATFDARPYEDPGVHEAALNAQPLYPSIQRSMENLARVVGESQEAARIQRTDAGEPILVPSILNEWAAEEGFVHRTRGTYHNEDTYLYVKGCNMVEKKEDIDGALGVARHLTSLGAIHPESRWGVYEIPNGYQLFVVSPELEPRLLNKKLEGAYAGRPQPEADLSHVEDWFKRIDPRFVPKQPIPEDSLLHHLSWAEASHADNWGWDSTGALYPVDVEVIHPTLPTYKNYEPWKINDHFDDYFD